MKIATTKSPARLSQDQAAGLYDRLAGVYDIWGKLTERTARNRALELADIRDGENVLEIAAGTGLAFEEIVRRNPSGQNLGIDISSGMLEKAERRLRGAHLRNYELVLGSALEIPASHGSFNVLLNNYMFDLLAEADWPRVLREFHRVLKPAGRLVLANMTLGERAGSGIYEWLYQASPALMGGCRGVRLAGSLADHGFELQSREYFQQAFFPSEVIFAIKA
jgi:ubiquinone/menaquinone biosynthesis C-methylase UbiE